MKRTQTDKDYKSNKKDWNQVELLDKKLEYMISNFRKDQDQELQNAIGNIIFIQDFGPRVLDKDESNNECLLA